MVYSKKRYIFYKKLLKFSFLLFKGKFNSNFNFLIFFFLKKLLKQITHIKDFIVFLPKSFEINKQKLLSFWKNGFITNFLIIRWLLIKKKIIKKLPFLQINLTSNYNINKEIQSKKLPTINFNNFNLNIFYDYYLITDEIYVFKNNVDNIYYYVLLLNYLDKTSNV